MRRSALKSASIRLNIFRILLVIGDREVESRTISVRTQEGVDLGVKSIDETIDLIQTESAKLGRTVESSDATSK